MGNALSKAAAELRRQLRPPVMKQTELAKRLGVSQQAVSAWIKGLALPEPKRMSEIESILGIPMRDWVAAVDEESVEEEGSHLARAV